MLNKVKHLYTIMKKQLVIILAAALVLVGCSKEIEYRTLEVVLENPSMEANVAGDEACNYLNEDFVGFRTEAGDRGAAKALFSTDGLLSMNVKVSSQATQLWCYTKAAIGEVQSFSLPSEIWFEEVPDYSGMVYCSKAVNISGVDKVTVPVQGISAGVRLQILDSRGELTGKGIKSVTLQAAGEEDFLTGTLALNFSRPGISAITDGSNIVTIHCVDQSDNSSNLSVGSLDTPAEVGAVILPCTFKGTVTVSGDDFTFVKEINAPVAFQAGYIKTLTIDAATSKMSKKLKVGVIGDSISSFTGYIPSGYKAYYPKSDCDVDKWYKTYWGILIQQYWNAELDVNCSWSGGCVASGVSGKSVGSDFVARCRDFKNPDIILLFGGTNDAIADNNVALGDYCYDQPFASINTTRRFRDAYIAVIKAIHANYPQAKIIIIVGTHVTGEYATSVVEIAKHYEIPYVDFRDDKGVTKYSGSHPNYNGMKYKAQKIYEETKDYIFN